jgi:biopolymer transport protein ExbD
MLVARTLSLLALFLIATPVIAQFQVHVLSPTTGKGVENQEVEIQAVPGREKLASDVTDRDGKCILKFNPPLPKGIKEIYVIVRPSAKSAYAPYGRLYDIQEVLKELKENGVIRISLKISRV